MIAKISHGSSLYGVLSYNQLKVDELHADVLSATGLSSHRAIPPTR